jgi:hypothetical protein
MSAVSPSIMQISPLLTGAAAADEIEKMKTTVASILRINGPLK